MLITNLTILFNNSKILNLIFYFLFLIIFLISILFIYRFKKNKISSTKNLIIMIFGIILLFILISFYLTFRQIENIENNFQIIDDQFIDNYNKKFIIGNNFESVLKEMEIELKDIKYKPDTLTQYPEI